MSTEASPPRPRAMLVSLGGSPAPVLFTLNEQRPDYILFFVSPQSARDVPAILRALTFPCRDSDCLATPSAELLGDCYRALRDGLPGKLAQWGIAWEDLTVDYTGGTKSMSAALVLATAGRVRRYSYVGGEERDKGGVGVVLDGKERTWFLQDPWQELEGDLPLCGPEIGSP